MKFKVGDKVKVRKDLKVNERYGVDFFVEDMKRFRGKIVTIFSVRESLEKYKIAQDAYGRNWTDEMFEDEIVGSDYFTKLDEFVENACLSYNKEEDRTADYNVGAYVKLPGKGVCIYYGEKYKVFDINITKSLDGTRVNIYRVGNTADYHKEMDENIITPTYVYENERGDKLCRLYKEPGIVQEDRKASGEMTVVSKEDIWKLEFWDYPMEIILTSEQFLEMVKILFRVIANFYEGKIECLYEYFSYEECDYVCEHREVINGD